MSINGQLLDASNNQDAKGFSITAVTKLKHADLWAAAKRFGGQAALAKHLGVSPQNIGAWIAMKRCPSPTVSRELEEKLFAVTGKSMDQLFPETLRKSVMFLNDNKVFERTEKLEFAALEHYAERQEERLQLEHLAETVANQAELKTKMSDAMDNLSEKERRVLEMRYGIGEYDEPHTLSETGKAFNVTRERLRQIESRALRRLKNPETAQIVVGCLD